MHTTLLSPFFSREWPPAVRAERDMELVVADTSPVRVGLLASADSNKVAAKSPVLLTSRDFALAEAWCFGNLPMVRARTAVDRGLGWGESEFPWALRSWAGTKGALAVPRNTPRMSDSALFVCSSFIVTHCIMTL